ncbi:MAG: hypothetical protein GX580_05630 [Candidatus Hydrogenedens sp.]|nr:hypothetical protein [Candidatus Hydrogenedens sp.]
MRRFAPLVTAVLLLAPAAFPQFATARHPLDQNNVVWDTPGGDSSGSMPMGNGDIGLNAWVEENGDLLLLLSKTDAWDAYGRLLKLGRVRISLSPSPFIKGGAFQQELKLRQGLIEITHGDGSEPTRLRVWVDANRPVVAVETEGGAPTVMEARLELWRTETRPFTPDELQSCRDIQHAEDGLVTPDTVLEGDGPRVAWYHRNETSVWPASMRHQGMESVMGQFSDPLLHRTFGAVMAGENLVKKDRLTLRSGSPTTTHRLLIGPLTAQTPTAEAWRDAALEQAGRLLADDYYHAFAMHGEWWARFWERSWLRVGGGADAEEVSRAYALQRWMNACAGRGAFPIKFNGSLFTVEWRENGEVKSDPDYRRWGGSYWWQNTRLPYFPMLASGDFDLMRPLFKMYMDCLPLANARSRIWFNCDGAVLPETMSFWGLYCNIDYGWDREGLEAGDMVNPYIRWIWSSGLELAQLMLDYYDHTMDDTFLKESLVPWADAALRYYDTRFARDKQGKLLITPTQAVETYQAGVVNDTPSLAGLRAVLPRLLALPEGAIGEEMRLRWTRMLGEVPELPTETRRGAERILPAETFKMRGNVENPELYPVFPFRLFGVDKPGLELARHTYNLRVEKAFNGWQQTAIQAALLGLADEARTMLVANVKNKHAGSRFPAFWGPNYDWVPDQDQAGNIFNTVQTMLMQADGKKILLFPAWPRDWEVAFKLHAPENTTVEGVYRDGKLEGLTVVPEARRADVVVMDPQ